MVTSITSNSITDGQKKQIKRFMEDAADRVFNDGVLDKDGAQELISNGDKLQFRVIEVIRELSIPNEFANEEVRAACYPKEYKGPKPIEQQIKAIAEIFGLDPALALEYVKNLPVLPEGAEGWFAIPSVDALDKKHLPEITDPAEKYCRALKFVHQKVAASRLFSSNVQNIDTAHIKVSARTMEKMNQIAAQQKGDILIIAAQLGKRHGGRSVRRARKVFVTNEYGLTSVAGGSIALVHPERFVRFEDLSMDMAGDEFSEDGDGFFGRAPCFGEAGFGTGDDSSVYGGFGSASGFVS